MSPVLKRRKLATIGNALPKAPSQQKQIQSFGKISKSAAAVPSVCKEEEDARTSPEIQQDQASPQINRKRKRVAIDEGPKRGVTAAPTKGIRGFSETLSFESKPSCPSTPSQSHCFDDVSIEIESTTCATSPTSSQGIGHVEQFPQELQDLIDLHSSFLRALSLHCAHHSYDAPIDLRILTPSVTRLWKRRAVTIDDVRRIIALAQSPLSKRDNDQQRYRLTLSDYGNGKICVEVKLVASGTSDHRQLIDEKGQRERLETNLRRQWTAHLDAIEDKRLAEPARFLMDLPLAPITVSKTVGKSTPLLAKGQRRLEELLRKAPQAPEPSSEPSSLSNNSSTQTPLTTTITTPPQSTPPLSRKSSLLSRIKAKQTHQASLPPAPSLAQTQRRTAIRRLEEIIPVFECLTASHSQPITTMEGEGKANDENDLVRPRSCTTPAKKLPPRTLSFSKSTLVTNLQQSMRNPISREEAARCIDVLAELAPGWVVVRGVGNGIGSGIGNGSGRGKLEGVTFRVVDGTLRGEVMKRVRAAMMEEGGM